MKEKALAYIKKFLIWWKGSAEERDGTTSGRRLSALFVTIFVYILGRISYMFYIMSTGIVLLLKKNVPVHDLHDEMVSTYYWLLWAFAFDIVFIGLLWGFITQQGIVEFKTGNKTILKTETSTTQIKTTEKTDTKKDQIDENPV